MVQIWDFRMFKMSDIGYHSESYTIPPDIMGNSFGTPPRHHSVVSTHEPITILQNCMCAAHHSLGDRWLDSGPSLRRHNYFDKGISCCGFSTEVVKPLKNRSEKQGFAVAKRMRNGGYSKDLEVIYGVA